MSLHTVGRMIVVPAAVAVAVGVLFRPAGLGAVLFATAAFLATQLVVLARSRGRLEAACRRVEATRAKRILLRRQRRP